MTYSVTPEIECAKCDNLGFMWPFGPICSVCNGMGWRAMTPDEEADAAEEEHRAMMEDFHDGGGSPTLAEQHRAAWAQKQELRR